jgi:hypothetical protein
MSYVPIASNCSSTALFPAPRMVQRLSSRFQQTRQSCAFLFIAARFAHSLLKPFFPALAPALDFSLTFCRHLASYSSDENELVTVS